MAFFSGDAGNNNISGTSSADTIFGVTGDDTLSGNQANDTLSGNLGNDFLFGGYDDDVLLGGRGNDFLSGDRGKDILQGDAGTDTLVGGENSDTFVINKKVNYTPNDNLPTLGDQILDFVDNEDFLGLNNLTSDDLIITSTSGNSTLITDRSGQALAVLQGVNPSLISAADFITQPQPNTLINGVASGDTTQNSTVLWAKSVTPGGITFEFSTDPNFGSIAGIFQTQVTDPTVPVKVEVTGLNPSTQYYYRVSDANQSQLVGKFQTSDPLGTRNGLRFGVSGDLQGNLAPFGPATVGFTPPSLLAEQGKSQAEYLALTDRADKDEYVRDILDYRTETLLVGLTQDATASRRLALHIQQIKSCYAICSVSETLTHPECVSPD